MHYLHLILYHQIINKFNCTLPSGQLVDSSSKVDEGKISKLNSLSMKVLKLVLVFRRALAKLSPPELSGAPFRLPFTTLGIKGPPTPVFEGLVVPLADSVWPPRSFSLKQTIEIRTIMMKQTILTNGSFCFTKTNDFEHYYVNNRAFVKMLFK